jgi:pimeloyl-ACP methyl ester carboxylesterase
MTDNRITVDGISAFYRESSGTGTPILFVHGNSFSSRAFTAQLESDLGRRHRCIAVDLPGHGDTEPAADPGNDYSLSGHGDFLLSFVQALDLTEFIAVGWSLGGHILLQVIEQMPAIGLVIAGTPPLGVPPAFEKVFLPLDVGSAFFTAGITEEQIDAIGIACAAPGGRISQELLNDLRRTDPRAREFLGVNTFSRPYRDESDVVRRLGIPLMVLHGADDRLVNLDYIRGLEMPTLWNGRVEVIAEAGHLLFAEQAERVNALLASFVEYVSAAMPEPDTGLIRSPPDHRPSL